jgi:hypothetical protein
VAAQLTASQEEVNVRVQKQLATRNNWQLRVAK